MINRLSKLYKEYVILIRKSNKIYDLDDNIVSVGKLKAKKYLIINNNHSYEVHKKTKL